MIKSRAPLVFWPLILLTIFFVTKPIGSATGDSDLNQTNISRVISGPDYEITEVIMPTQISWIEPGTYIHPSITVRNDGADDTGSQTVQIQARLGKYQLISRNNQISPFKSGEKRQVAPDYLIPSGVPSGEYSLIVTIDSVHDQKGANTSSTQVSAQDKVNIKLVTPKAKVSGCGCS